MTQPRPKYIVQAERFRVFRFIKQFRKQTLRNPRAMEIAEALDIEYSIAHSHMERLEGADGIGRITRFRRELEKDNGMKPVSVDVFFHQHNAK